MKENKKTIKTYFETGDKPTQEQFENLIDSYIDSKQPEGEPNRSFVIAADGKVSLSPQQTNPEYTISEITGNKLALLKDGQIVTKIDLTSYIDDTNLARLVSGSVDANGIATFTRDDDSNFTLDLSNLKSNLNLQKVTDEGSETSNNINIIGNKPFLKVSNNSNKTGRLGKDSVIIEDDSLSDGARVDLRSSNISFRKTGGILSLNSPSQNVYNDGNKKLNIPYKNGTLATLEDLPTLQAGTNITIDTTNPSQPIINATAGTSGDGFVDLTTRQTITGRKKFSTGGSDEGITVTNTSSFGGIAISNEGTTNSSLGMKVTNVKGTGIQINCKNTSLRALEINLEGALQYGIKVNNAGIRQGIQVITTAQGTAIQTASAGTGTGIEAFSSGSGVNIKAKSTDTATGNLFEGDFNNNTVFSVNKEGGITSTSSAGYIGKWDGLERSKVSIKNQKERNVFGIREFNGNYTITNLDGLITTDEISPTIVTIPTGLEARNMLVFNRGNSTLTITKANNVTTYPTTDVILNQNESADIIYVSPDNYYIIKR